MHMRLTYLALAASMFFCGDVLAASSTYRVTLAKGTTALTTQSVTARTDSPATVERKVPFEIPVGGCMTSNAGHPQTIGGTGRSGQKVTVNQVAADGMAATVRLNLDSNELASVLPTAAGACRGQTPAMVHWDASATFTLQIGDSNSFSVGEYTVVVTLMATTSDRSPGFRL